MLAENTNGMSFLEDLQSSKKGNLIPTVFLTNNVNEEEKEKAIALGAKDYLPKAKQKPSDIIDLVKRHVV
jgi:CheY-like chemotaxis protein